MRLGVCILHYGNAEMTKNIHRQFLAGDSGRDRDILVLDNASPEPYPDAFERLPENIFWGGALEYAVGKFADMGYTHVWFCNNDVSFLSDPPYYSRAAQRLQWLEKRGRAGLYSPAVSSNPYHAQMVRIAGAECTRVHYIDGIAPIISLECVGAVGGLDTDGNRFGYGVDVWLSLRASRAGWNVWVDHAVLLRHKYHETAGRAPGFLDKAARAENAYLAERLGADWRRAVETLQKPLETI
jgi:GT2 family glycosyltransferase